MATVVKPSSEPESDELALLGTSNLVEETTDDPADSAPELDQAENYNWPVMSWIGALHLGALAAPFFFSWEGLLLMFVLHWITGGIGICLGFHRLLTHGSFQTYRPVRYFLSIVGGLAGEGAAIDWVAAHRKHHAFSDREGDPHSPHDGAWWAHVLWLGQSVIGNNDGSFARRWAPDLQKDPVMRAVGRLAIPLHFVLGGILCAAGYLYGGTHMAWSFLFWGVFARLVFVLHSTWFVNSASHMWGYRNYTTTDDSTNNWWVAVLSYGEGWHNNHHAYPRMANHGHTWWEIDPTFRTIRLMERLGIAWDVVDYKHRNAKAGS